MRLDSYSQVPARCVCGQALPLLFVLILSSAAIAVEFLSPDEIRVGMKGIGKSVFKGTEIEDFEVEVLGVLEKSYVGNDMILVKCRGANLEHTGVIAGMSGSPVYIDGKLVGAIAMTYGFQKDPLAEVTPIQSMIDNMKRADRLEESSVDDGLLGQGAQVAPALSPADRRPIPCPLTMSGFDRRLAAAFAPRLAKFGLQLTPGSGEATGAHARPTDKELQPGSAIGVCLIRGDANASAIGTLTYREGNRIAAFGHPMFWAGAVNMPMVGGIIHTIMPSQELSFKIFSATEPIGAVTQDRATGIAGTIGAQVKMIPAAITVRSEGRTRAYHYELLNHRLITPDLLDMVIADALLSREQSGFDFSAQAEVVYGLRGYPPVRFTRWFSGEAVVSASARALSQALSALTMNPYEKVQVESIRVDIAVTPGRNWLTIERAMPDRERVRPGEKVELNLTLRALRGATRHEAVELAIPDNAPVGELKLLVAAPDTVLMVQAYRTGDGMIPRSVAQIIQGIERLKAENEIVIQGYVEREGVAFAGREYPNLPPTMRTLMRNQLASDNADVLETDVLFERRLKFSEMIAGAQIVRLQVIR